MTKGKKIVKVEISQKTILFILALIVGYWLINQAKDVFLGLFVALILVGALNPTVEKLEKWKIPRWLAISFLYFSLIIIFVLVVSGLIPPFLQQTIALFRSLPIISRQIDFLGLDLSKILTDHVNQELVAIPSGAIKLTISILSNIVSVLGVLVISFYLLLEHKNIDRYLFYFFGQEDGAISKRIIMKLEKRLGSWIRVQLLLMTVIGTLSYIGFRLLSLEFALPLAILAGLLEVVPNIGPILAAIPAILFGLSNSPLTGLVVAAWCFLIQQLENNLIVPKLMKRVTGVNPVITLLALAIGLKIAGVVGMVLAIPTYLTIEVLAKELLPLLKNH